MWVMTALGAVGRQVRWLAGAFALLDLLATGYVVLARIPAADPRATWLWGTTAAVATFAILTGVGVGLQLTGELLAARAETPVPTHRPAGH